MLDARTLLRETSEKKLKYKQLTFLRVILEISGTSVAVQTATKEIEKMKSFFYNLPRSLKNFFLKGFANTKKIKILILIRCNSLGV